MHFSYRNETKINFKEREKKRETSSKTNSRLDSQSRGIWLILETLSSPWYLALGLACHIVAVELNFGFFFFNIKKKIYIGAYIVD